MIFARLQLRSLLGVLVLLVVGAGCTPRTRTSSLPPPPSPPDAESGRGRTLEEARVPTEVPIIRDEALPDVPPDARIRGSIDPPIAPDVPETLVRDTLSADLSGNLRLSLDQNDLVRARLTYFTQGPGRNSIEIGLERAERYRGMIQRILEEEGLPPSLIYLAQAESGFRPDAVSRSAARGMWQFIPARGEEYGLRQNWWIDERSDPEKSTRAAARHLRDLFDQFGDWYLAMAAYNAGPGGVARAIEKAGSRDFWHLSEQGLFPAETRNYVPTIIAMALIGSDPSRYGFEIEPADAVESVRVEVSQTTDLRIVAERLGLPLDEIRNLNPHLLRWATPPNDGEFRLVLPATYRERFAREVDSLAEEERILFRHHQVSPGQTLSHIARIHAVSRSAIAEVNGLTNPDALAIGQSLAIPFTGSTLSDTAQADFGASSGSPPRGYRVRPGDTLTGLADRFGLRIAQIRAWNGMESTLLIAGDVLQLVPDPTTATGGPRPGAGPQPSLVYRVRRGDTLWSIAAAHSTSVAEIRGSNRDLDLTVIHPGDLITLWRAETSEIE